MAKTKRDDKKKIANYIQEDRQTQSKGSILGKSVLLLVEGDTEKAYFENLKQNPWLKNSLSGVTIKIENSYKNSDKYNGEIYEQKWYISDNDKRNAFILEKEGKPFFDFPTDLPQNIIDSLRKSYSTDNHNFFLSIHDFLKWLESVIGEQDTINYWDRIQHLVEKKKELQRYDYDLPSRNLRLAYSCISFEFWLILHFQKNNTPFIWVDKNKDALIDVVTHLRTIMPKYEKGYYDSTKKEKDCHAYSCLYEDIDKKIQTKDDEWLVLIKIFSAIKNAKWLRDEMSDTLKRQSGKWYEVNPYIKGIDDLLIELLNVKLQNETIKYFDLILEFNFDSTKKQLFCSIENKSDESFLINDKHKNFFEIKDNFNMSFIPKISTYVIEPNESKVIDLLYDIEQSENHLLTLIFNDPRQKSKSSQLFILLN